MSEISTGSNSIGSRRGAAGINNMSDCGAAVSWSAIFTGAVGAAVLSLLLLILGTGLGLSSVSPWTMEGINATTFGFAAIAWLSFTQLVASGMGGYLAGRLRTKWMDLHTDEVYFRDTAHGFLAWAIASLLTAALLTSVVGSIISGGVQAGAAVAGGTASAIGSAATLASPGADSDDDSNTIGYFVDSLFRGDPGDAAEGVEEQAREISDIPTGEVTRIFAQSLRTGTLSPEDERYIGQLIAQRTDLSQQDAEQRVSEGFDAAQTTLEEARTTALEVADEARKSSAYGALWVFVTLLIGAFAASLMAVFGGRQRDTLESYPL